MSTALAIRGTGWADLWASCQRGICPDPILTVSEWADQYRWLSGKAASEPGKWRTSRTPYMQKIMDALSATSPFTKVVLCKGSQVGGTELLLNWVGYIVDQVPGPMMIVSPTVDLAKRFSKQRLDAMIDDTPCLRGKVKDPRSRDSGNTLLMKEYPNGVTVLTGANSGVGLRSMPARYLLLDEVDGYPASADDEGDPVELAQRALRTFGRRKKIFMNSTPLVAGASRIERELEGCDQRWTYHVPCPECHALQPLEWAQIKYPEGAPREAKYQCRACEALIPEHLKTWMLDPAHGATWFCEWDRGSTSIGFHLSALYSPFGWFSWAEAAEKYERGKDDADLLRIFSNTVLGLGFQEKTEAPDWKRLAARRETYRIGDVPEGDPVHTDCRPVFLTGAADVQKGRIECFDDQTEVLTDCGWRPFGEVNLTNNLATVNLETDVLEFQSPTHLVKQRHVGDMIAVTTKTLDLMVTPNHRMVVYKGVGQYWKRHPRIVLAAELQPSHRIKVSVPTWEGVDTGKIEIGEATSNVSLGVSGVANVRKVRGKYLARVCIEGKRISRTLASIEAARAWVDSIPGVRSLGPPLSIDLGDMCEFVGWYLSEGHTAARTYSVCISQNRGHKADRIAALLKRLPYHVYPWTDGRREVFKIHSKALTTWLSDHCGHYAHGKRVPALLKNVPRACLGRLLDGLFLGDGWVQRGPGRKPHQMFGTVSKQLADDVQELLIRMGHRANVASYPPANPRVRGMFYVSQLTSHASAIKTKRGERRFSAVRREAYDGLVYCATVPNGTLVCRRNGKMFVAGNCEIKAWNRRKESWSIAYEVLEGDIAGADVWRELDAVLAKDWPCAGGGTLPIRVFCVDSGYESERVYEWARRHPQPTWVKQTGVANCRQPRTVAVVKGVERGMSIVWSSTRADLGGRRGLRIYSVSNFQTKAELYGWLRLDPPTAEEAAAGAKHPPGYCHVPQYSDEYFKQLTSETVVTTMVKGFPKRTFQLQKGLRNEVLDAAAYNRAAAELFGLTRFQDRHWRELAQARGIVRPGPPSPPDPPIPTPATPGPQPRVRRARPVRYRMGG